MLIVRSLSGHRYFVWVVGVVSLLLVAAPAWGHCDGHYVKYLHEAATGTHDHGHGSED